jgi:hypothetical protein
VDGTLRGFGPQALEVGLVRDALDRLSDPAHLVFQL